MREGSRFRKMHAATTKQEMSRGANLIFREKMVRDRLGRWGLANKYRRTIRSAATTSSPPDALITNGDDQQSPPQTNQVGFVISTIVPHGITRLPRMPTQERLWNQVLSAANNWYLSLAENGTFQRPLEPCGLHIAIAKFQQALFAQQLHQKEKFSWRLLSEAGQHVAARVKDDHPAILPSLLAFLRDLPSGKDNKVAAVIRRYLIRESQASLAPAHPVALLCNISRLPVFPEQLCQLLLRVFESHFPLKSGSPNFEALATKICLLCCDVYIKQGRFEEAERLLERVEPTQGSTLTLTKTYRFRAYSRQKQDDLDGALRILNQAWRALRERKSEVTRLGCKILADLALIHDALDDLPSCEEALQHLLGYHMLTGGDFVTRLIITKQLEDALLKQEKWTEAATLKRRFPEAFDAEQYYDSPSLRFSSLPGTPSGLSSARSLVRTF